MKKYCGICGRQLNEKTGRCPVCNPPRNAGGHWYGVLAVLLLVAALLTACAGNRSGETAAARPAESAPKVIGTGFGRDTVPEEAPVPAWTEAPAPSWMETPDPWEVPVEEKRPVAVDGGRKHSVILYNDGTVVTLGDDTKGQRSTTGWKNIVAISTFYDHTLGLKADGTVVAAGENGQGQCEVSEWKNIVAIAAGTQHSVGVRADGTVVAVGANTYGQCDVSEWTGVRAVAASNGTTFALTNEGRVLVSGCFENRYLDNWRDIVAISVSANHVVGIHSDGTLSSVGANDRGQQENLGKWMDTDQIAVGYGFTVGLREKGSVWVHGCDEHNEHAAMSWTDVVAIGTGTEHILGIRADGTLLAKGTNDCGQCDVYRLNG